MKEYSYRENAIPPTEQKPKEPFKKRHPKLMFHAKSCMQYVVGFVIITLSTAILILGPYYFGLYIIHYIFHEKPIGDGQYTCPWALGLIGCSLTFLLAIVSRAIGKSILK